MNNVAALPVERQTTDIAVQPDFSSQGLLMDFQKFQLMQQVAEAMSTAAIAVPQHFRGKPGDCLAVVMQATQWGMNPFAVAQKTHVVNGALGYEAQLVNAVVQTSGAIVGRFHYDYRGDGNDLECRVGAVPRGETEIVWNEWLKISAITTKNSPLWKTNPRQQMGYLQVKNWARLHAPGAILGVYSDDELDVIQARDMGAAEIVDQDETKPASNSRTAALKSHMGVGKDKPAGKTIDVPVLAEVVAAIQRAETPEEMTAAAKICDQLADSDKPTARRAYKERLEALKEQQVAKQEAEQPAIDPDDAFLKGLEAGSQA